MNHRPHLRGIFASRSGIFFTLIGIMVITLLLVYVGATYRITLVDRSASEAVRIDSVTTLVGDLEARYFPAALVSVSQNSLEAMSRFAASYGADNAGESPYEAATLRRDFNETMMQGTLAREGVSFSGFGLTHTLPSFLSTLITVIEDAHRVDIDYAMSDPVLVQYDPFWLNVSAVVNYTVHAREGGVSYTRTNINLTGKFSILGLSDPLYEMRSRGTLHNAFRETAFDGGLSPADVQALIVSGNYTRDAHGLSYLERFIGEEDSGVSGLNTCGCGLFSLLDPAEVGSDGEASFADYTFRRWEGQCADRHLYIITGISPTFHINEHFVDNIFSIDPSMLTEISNLDTTPPVNECKDG